MASKQAAADHLDTAGPSQSPPSVSLSDKLLSSVISLPDNPCIAYSIFTPTSSNTSHVRHHDIIELARRQILTRNRSLSLLDSWLPSVNVNHDSALYVFSITSHDHTSQAQYSVNGLHFDGLHVSESSSFSPQDIYPCSLHCSTQRIPCPTCLELQPPPSPTATATTRVCPIRIPTSFPDSASCLLPRQPLRVIFSQFLEALRNRIIDDISLVSKNCPSGRPVNGFKGGFLLGPLPSSSEWSSGWHHYALTRPTIYCHLEINFTRSRIIINPLLRPTHFFPLHSFLPLVPGTPITLIPYAIPAYFLSTYAGPTSALTAQFDESLSGLGAGDWKTSSPHNGAPTHSEKCPDHAQSSGTSFIIAWISVENKQGEDKGITVIWPTRLCLSFLPSSTSAHARTLLSCFPVLPSQLQSSPPAPSGSSAFTHAIDHGQTINASASFSGSGLPIRRRGCRTPTSDSLRAFRTFTLFKSKDISHVAIEVGSYVDAIAKERERERERIKRERENVGTSISPRTVLTPSAPGPGGLAVTPVPTPGAAHNDIVDSLNSPPSTVLLPTTTSQSLMSPLVTAAQSQIYPNQHFYPSPPQTNLPPSDPVDAMQTSPVMIAPSLPNAPDSIQPLHTDLLQGSSPTSFDAFGNIDTSWSQQRSNDFLDMSMDFGMGFNMDMAPITGGGGGGSTNYDRGGMDYEDAFTDDDFSFFDRPSRTAPVNASSLLNHISSGLTPASDPAPLTFSSPLFSDGLHMSGPGSLAFTPGQQLVPSPWASGPLGDAFTPKFAESDIIHPDILPLSPGQTPWSHSAPASPNVQLSYDYDRRENRRPITSHGPSAFDPIPFAPCHRASDGKYVVGKFALPSPPDEEDRTEPIPSVPLRPNGWRSRYNAATDPRIGVVRKLIGVKRKSFDQGFREAKTSSSWHGERDDWVKNVGPDVDDDKSEAESEDMVAENDSPIVSRPSTPPPAYLPLGPSLLHTQFQHCQLLPLSTPLRSPGAAVAPANIASPPAPTSVPTPVSPAAVIGAVSEKSKSLEAAAYTVAREVVENVVWAGAWQANISGSGSPKQGWEVWQTDVTAVKDLLEGVPVLAGTLDLAALFELDFPSIMSGSDPEPQLRPMEPPMISVCKADAIIQVLPTALRFWEKLGLGPRGGKKDVTAFVLFEGESYEQLHQAESWLCKISTSYHGKRFGRHIAGSCSICSKDGIVPIRFDSFRKSLHTVVANLPSLQGNQVFYIVTPANAMTLASPLLRQVFSAVKRTLTTYSDSHFFFHFVPEHLVFGSIEHPAAHDADLEMLCYSVYNRILQPVDRLMARRFFEHGEKIQNHVQDPAFTLARPLYNKVKLLWQAPARSLDVMDRHTLLHVGYQTTPCGKWILAACIDQRGEAHDIGVWLTQSESSEAHIVTQVWGFASQFARKANLEWRLAIAKLGSMRGSELDAWMMHLSAVASTCHELSTIHVSLLSVEPDVPWTFIAPQNVNRPANTRRMLPKDKLGSIFVDSSASTYALFPTSRMPLSSTMLLSRDLGAELPFVPEPDDIALCDNLGVLPLSTSILVRIPSQTSHTSTSMLHIYLLHTINFPNSSLAIGNKETHADITRNYHDLAVLTWCRWRMTVNPILPFHLAAVEAMQMALDRGDSTVDY